jgi:transcription elongation factor GreB
MLREIDSRIRFLSKRLDDMTVVDRPPADPSRVFFGAWVTLEDDEGVSACYRLVGPDETDAGKGWISIDAPLARALLKKQVDDEAEVDTPSGRKLWYISAIRYEPC